MCHRPRLRRTLTWPVSSLVTTRSSAPLAGRVDRLDVGDAQADGQSHRRQEGLGSNLGSTRPPSVVAEEHREGAVAGVADDQVVPAVAVEVGRDDLRRELAGRERSDPDEAAVAVGVERDRIVVGVDAGQQRALDRCSGPRRYRARGSRG